MGILYAEKVQSTQWEYYNALLCKRNKFFVISASCEVVVQRELRCREKIRKAENNKHISVKRTGIWICNGTDTDTVCDHKGYIHAYQIQHHDIRIIDRFFRCSFIHLFMYRQSSFLKLPFFPSTKQLQRIILGKAYYPSRRKSFSERNVNYN